MSDDTRDIVERWAAATPGPWKIEREELGVDFSDEEQATAFPERIGPIFSWVPHDTDEEQNEADAQAIAHAPEDVARLLAEVERLRSALAFYADPGNYHGIRFWQDRPAGAFADDFSEDHGDDFYDRPMPGKLARKALNLGADESVCDGCPVESARDSLSAEIGRLQANRDAGVRRIESLLDHCESHLVPPADLPRWSKRSSDLPLTKRELLAVASGAGLDWRTVGAVIRGRDGVKAATRLAVLRAIVDLGLSVPLPPHVVAWAEDRGIRDARAHTAHTPPKDPA